MWVLTTMLIGKNLKFYMIVKQRGFLFMMTVFLQTWQKIMTYFQTKMIKFKHDPLIIKDFVVQNITFCPLEGHILYIYIHSPIYMYIHSAISFSSFLSLRDMRAKITLISSQIMSDYKNECRIG